MASMSAHSEKHGWMPSSAHAQRTWEMAALISDPSAKRCSRLCSMLLAPALDISCSLISVSTPASSSPLAAGLCGLSRPFQAAATAAGVFTLLLRQACLISRCANR